MDEVTARAVLVPASDVSDGVTTSVPRSEIEEVLEANEMPIELVLDVARLSDGELAEAHSVAVSWERSELERLLGEAEGDEVILTFDRETLRRAIEDDVEAHGFREVTLALAIAGTAAMGAAGTASAEPGAFLGSGTPIVQQAGTSPDDRAVARGPAVPAPELSPDDRAVPRGAPVPTAAPGVSPDDRAVPRGPAVPPAALSPDDRAFPRSAPTPAPTSAPSVSPDDRAFPRSTPVAAPVTGTASDPGTSWSPSGAETVAIAGAIVLLITGAYFVVGGRRGPRVRPT
ncbi:MAG TPA: hypothetical protein VE440_02955 [Gaiellaceae bacterium]|nr:hypothetical protein [Gaiellaceae bacterium]